MTEPNRTEMRQVYARVVADLFAEYPEQVYALEADLSSAMATTGLRQVMADHYLNVGIMEAHLVGVAAGLGLTGGFGFVHSFGQFLARRAMDQIFVSLAYSGIGACLVGSDAGISAEHNGGTHMTFEDLGIVRGIPGITVWEVCDPVQFAAMLRQAFAKGGLSYIRTIRKAPGLEVYPRGHDFGSGGATRLREGSDITLIGCGMAVAEALRAAELLHRDGIGAEVIDAFRVAPLDAEVILDSVTKTNTVVTCENHSVINGLGSAVAELLAEHHPARLYRVGVRNAFGQVGTVDYLAGCYRMRAEDIADQARRLLED